MIVAGQKFGHWHALVIDGKRTTAMCRCGTVRVLSTDELVNGTIVSSCGCAPTSTEENQRAPERTL
jgi:hypothetical protein